MAEPYRSEALVTCFSAVNKGSELISKTFRIEEGGVCLWSPTRLLGGVHV